MRLSWTHVGRIWTNGEPFLAMDARLREHWHGGTDEDAFEEICDLGWEVTGLPVGPDRAALVGTDGVVGDEGWLEVFTAGHDALAVVQVSGADYGSLLGTALGFPTGEDTPGDVIEVGSGALALFSAALDGTGPDGAELVRADPGPPPVTRPRTPRGIAPGLLVAMDRGAYTLRVRWYTELGDDGCFARWLLMPRGDDG
ncbi:hypothetical protein GCM10027176_32490 [Actinoallomurus bryophytorum]|uniref:Immunity protein 21 of polymorphic toxin system n=1 Tax=Actinoallomurus bryophytorum TaxID=1490222 RepID=A0A543BT79_9ACTN|nr:hypothetical protein [Actinoallomurus bryophytorum]TQL88045.1 hypothetical protein FB559_8658 [Actinoallomurus bryophytorum]